MPQSAQAVTPPCGSNLQSSYTARIVAQMPLEHHNTHAGVTSLSRTHAQHAHTTCWLHTEVNDVLTHPALQQNQAHTWKMFLYIRYSSVSRSDSSVRAKESTLSLGGSSARHCFSRVKLQTNNNTQRRHYHYHHHHHQQHHHHHHHQQQQEAVHLAARHRGQCASSQPTNHALAACMGMLWHAKCPHANVGGHLTGEHCLELQPSCRHHLLPYTAGTTACTLKRDLLPRALGAGMCCAKRAAGAQGTRQGWARRSTHRTFIPKPSMCSSFKLVVDRWCSIWIGPILSGGLRLLCRQGAVEKGKIHCITSVAHPRLKEIKPRHAYAGYLPPSHAQPSACSRCAAAADAEQAYAQSTDAAVLKVRHAGPGRCWRTPTRSPDCTAELLSR